MCTRVCVCLYVHSVWMLEGRVECMRMCAANVGSVSHWCHIYRKCKCCETAAAAWRSCKSKKATHSQKHCVASSSTLRTPRSGYVAGAKRRLQKCVERKLSDTSAMYAERCGSCISVSGKRKTTATWKKKLQKKRSSNQIKWKEKPIITPHSTDTSKVVVLLVQNDAVRAFESGKKKQKKNTNYKQIDIISISDE